MVQVCAIYDNVAILLPLMLASNILYHCPFWDRINSCHLFWSKASIASSVCWIRHTFWITAQHCCSLLGSLSPFYCMLNSSWCFLSSWSTQAHSTFLCTQSSLCLEFSFHILTWAPFWLALSLCHLSVPSVDLTRPLLPNWVALQLVPFLSLFSSEPPLLSRLFPFFFKKKKKKTIFTISTHYSLPLTPKYKLSEGRHLVPTPVSVLMRDCFISKTPQEGSEKNHPPLWRGSGMLFKGEMEIRGTSVGCNSHSFWNLKWRLCQI